MDRGRRSIRNPGKRVAGFRERMDRCISDDDWYCSSEEDGESDGEEELEKTQDASSASTRSSVKRVASVVAKFDERKRELVRSIGFGGILELQQINKVSRRFTVWLLSRLDTENRTIEVDGEPIVDMVDFDVKRIMGIPCGSREVTPLDSDDPKAKKTFMQQSIGALSNETNSLLAAARVVTKDYPSRMSKKQCDNFKVSFVVFIVGYLLAPTKKNNVGNSSFWGALTVPDEIPRYNWAEYVLSQLMEAAVNVQTDIRNKKKISNVTGCSILLQIMYLETLKIDGIERQKDVYPIIKAYTSSYLRTMVEADKASSSTGGRNPTWGSTLGRRAPTNTINTKYNEAMLLSKLGQMGQFREELKEFAKDNFSGKLNESHINAMIAYGERCSTHWETLKTSIMKENLFLVEMLLYGSSAGPGQNISSNAINRSYDAPRCSKVQSNSHAEKVDTGFLRGYESACEGSQSTKTPGKRPLRSYRDTNKSSSLNEEVLGAKDGSNSESEANKRGSGSGGVAAAMQPPTVASVHQEAPTGHVEPPSFDLGIDFQTQEKYMEAKKALSETRNDGDTTINNVVHFASLGHTPASAKRKSDALQTGSPDQRFKTSTTSPASMSKILANAAVFARMIQSEDELDVNIQPWDHDTTDSPVTKQTIENGRLAKSPWFHGLSCNTCVSDVAESIYNEVMTIGKTDLERLWIVHRVPRYLEVSGSCIKDSFSLKDQMGYELYDLALRRLVQLDGVMYKDYNDKRWRHILESDFAVLAQAGEKPAFHKSIREQFFGPGVNYKVNRCRMIVIPAQVVLNWCCYFWDFKKRCVHIFDPFYKEEHSAEYKKMHGPIVDKIGAELANCIELFYEKWSVEWSEWRQEYVLPQIVVGNRHESAIISLMSIQEFDGEGFRNMTPDSYKKFKMMLLAEMLSIGGNQAAHPVKWPATKATTPIIHTIDD